MTTAHASNKIDKGKTNPVTKEPIVKYQNMGAVDRSDQMLTHNAFKRRTIKWWKKIFFHMFMLGGLNAFLIHKATGARKLSHVLSKGSSKAAGSICTIAIKTDGGNWTIIPLSPDYS